MQPATHLSRLTFQYIAVLILLGGLASWLEAQESSAGQEQPARRNLRNPYEGSPISPDVSKVPGAAPETCQAGQNSETSHIEPSAPYPPYPNYPESNLPSPPRAPKQQEYLYLNHLYFEPLTMAVGGFISFGWLGMIRSGKVLRLGLDIYNAGINLAVLTQGQIDNDDYRIMGLLLRVGLHFFTEPNQLKGFEIGVDLRSGIAVLPASGSAVVIQASIEVPFAYRFVTSFYSRTGRQALNLGFAPYIVLSVGGYLGTSKPISVLRNSDNDFLKYMNNGNFFIEPNFINDIELIALKVAIRLGFDVSFIF